MTPSAPAYAGAVVVADDDDDARYLVASAVRKLGGRVAEATNGVDLVSVVTALKARAVTVELVISDIGMPECDGIDATLELLRIDPELNVVLVTAFQDQTTARRARECGARHVLQKPLVLAALEKLIGERKSSPPVA